MGYKKDTLAISTCRKCGRIIKHLKIEAAKCPDCSKELGPSND